MEDVLKTIRIRGGSVRNRETGEYHGIVELAGKQYVTEQGFKNESDAQHAAEEQIADIIDELEPESVTQTN